MNSSVTQGDHKNLQLHISTRQVTIAFVMIVTALLVLHILVNSLRFALDNEKLYGLVYMFSVGADGNFPTFYSAFALLFAGGLLLLTGYLAHRLQRRHWLYWPGLGAVFCFLAADEMLELHERLIEPVRNLTHASGLLYYAWVIPYALGLLVLGLVYLRFLLNLPRRTAWLFVIAGGVYVMGAVGFEMLGGLFFENYGSNTPGYVALQTIEEGMEMGGVVLFIYALLDYITHEFGGLQISLDNNAG